jgi:hypothetical protein
MELHFTPEQEARLTDIAQQQGLTPDAFVRDVTLGLIEEPDEECEIIRGRVRQADKGIFIEEEEMDARFRAMLQRK